ncbi:TonB-dependent receptor [Roseateles depolymerans]|uniref:TonB-dependent outer membrane receptor n=1 Tax=Roseateles depolymerans TaxID=76731 RepID=A0A0U3NFR9_9BURK|nr:TonB-dependent receptor [Roseateles depolymerans]ALV07280.1 TonB-dependent outer membrane receptor [Roseateles depolymerans]REG20263.1 TonB-dependent receptor [Roseateles depolymerans]
MTSAHPSLARFSSAARGAAASADRASPAHQALQVRPVAVACALLFVAAAAHAQAQQAPQTPVAPAGAASAAKTDAQLDTVVVTGIRQSLDTSLNLKRQQRGVVDGIVAEDIGKFPDTNLAESMQRISGVSIDRSMGEGSRVTVRGVGPDFNLVLLNGRQMPASSIADTQASNSRAFDFANLASESVSALEVYKTSRASSPTGGIGATINIKTARPLDTKRTVASIGLKAVHDEGNSRLPDTIKGSSITPEVSGIYSTTFGDGRFGLAVSGSFQRRDAGYNSAGVPGGWLPIKGDESLYGAIPLPGQPGADRITNRPGPTDVYSVPQNVNYNMNGVRRERTNGQVTFQFAPTRDLTTTVDYTASQNKLHTRRNDMSAWFSFGPSSSSWTNGPVAAPLTYTELITAGNADLAMAGGDFATKNTNKSLGFNVDWKASNKLRFEFDAHHSTAESGADGPWGTNNVIGTASFNRGITSVDFSQDLPVLIMPTTQRDASLQQVTGSSFRNSYMKSQVDQQQVRGSWTIDEVSKLDFGLGLSKVRNRSAYSFVQLDNWGGTANGWLNYPDEVWIPQDLRNFFGKINGGGDPRLFTQFFTFDFGKIRQLASDSWGDPSKYLATDNFSTDRRTTEKSTSLYGEYTREWELGVPMSATLGMRYERTKVDSTALVPIATGISWGSNNELTVLKGDPGFTALSGKYSYWLPSIDWEADLTDKLKLRASYGTSLGRPGWDAIQGGQTLDNLARLSGGTGSQGNPSLKPLKSKNIDFSLEYYYAKSSYVAAGVFRKNISNYIGSTINTASPFNLHTPVGGKYFTEAASTGGCGADITCIRDYILNRYNGQPGVTKTGESNGHALGTITGQPDDPVATFQITTPANTQSNSLKGFELNVQHAFGNSGFGVAANYTKVKSGLKYDNMSLTQQYALVGLSDSANLVGFYEDNKFSVRVAYNWRDKFLAAVNDGNQLGRSAPIYTEPYAQVDVSVGYNFTDKLSMQAEVINLGDAILRQHGRTEEEVFAVTQTGRRYMLGLRYKF